MYSYRSLLSPKLKTFLRLESFQKSRTEKRPLLLARSVCLCLCLSLCLCLFICLSLSRPLSSTRQEISQEKTQITVIYFTYSKIIEVAMLCSIFEWGKPYYRHWYGRFTPQGWGLLSQFPPFRYFLSFFSVVRTHVSYWISRLYLTGVAAAQLRGHLSNIHVIQRI